MFNDLELEDGGESETGDMEGLGDMEDNDDQDADGGLGNEDYKQMAAMFKLLKAKTNNGSPQDLAQMVSDFVQSPGVKKEPSPGFLGAKAAAAVPKFVVGNFPRLPVFSGTGKDSSYDLWKYEVECINADHPPSTVRESIRRSLRGTAANVAMRLGPSADIISIMQKMDSVYGSMVPDDRLMAEFYSAKQKSEEDVAAWGCRLEELLSKVEQQGLLDQMGCIAKEKMLVSTFWSGLLQPLKDISGYLHDQACDFDQFRVRVRQLEQDRSTVKPKVVPSKAAVESSEISELKVMVKQLATDVRTMKEEGRGQQPQQQRAGNPRRQAPPTAYQPQYQAPSFNQPQQTPSSAYQPQYQPPRSFNQQQPSFNQQQPAAYGGDEAEGDDIVCWRCGQIGHVQLGCRVRLDHQRKGLNSNRPASRGGR
jgi:hypothetical protein